MLRNKFYVYLNNNEFVYKTIDDNNFNILNILNKNVNSNNTCLIVIDMLNIFVRKSGDLYHENYKKMIPGINRMISLSRENNMPIIFLQHSYRDMDKPDRLLQVFKVENLLIGSFGVQIYKKLDVQHGKDYIIQKRRYSGFFGTDLDLILRENHIENLIVVGCKTNNCVRALVQDAFNLNYNTIIPHNLITTDDDLIHQVNLKDMIDFFSINYISEEKIKELLKNK
ncbi:hypothetical protein DICPUDRAFT_146856 [Dictyostelium purpureum]|uniref:Isochorismatase-like domain-containing protein n=1 Tax=Dictyostelium purpureum TaxID=5786 RepID=F0Z728_DICPU|nr:uncharacterized protein DICPUDRAFT_146856 [Dictyostelium purpureum]EGC40262.1 hypothetical protein DICPUDRAFT_146856 [Dictyostelium purpureum]|eukprot:XP_003283198.1 hypothetical protein DICPUDRAFT_146856 [Dictyostelium purpureum]